MDCDRVAVSSGIPTFAPQGKSIVALATELQMHWREVWKKLSFEAMALQRSGKTPAQIADQWQFTIWRVYKLLDPTFQPQFLKLEKSDIDAIVEQIRSTQDTYADIGRRFFVGREVVRRIAQKHKNLRVPPVAPVAINKVTTYTCPSCGNTVQTAPCVICLARSYRQQRRDISSVNE